MSVLGWIVIGFLSIYMLAMLALIIYLAPEIVRERWRLRAKKNE